MLLDWKTGFGTCNHCGEVVQLHTFKKKEQMKIYDKPVQNDNRTIDPRVADYFSGRGISLATLQTAGVTTKPGWIEFNYYAHGELINRKSRNAKKEFRLERNCELIWFNFDALTCNDSIIIVEGEPDALSYIEAGCDNVISVPNGASNFGFLDTSIDYFDHLEKIYLSMDNDDAGLKLQAELIRRLGTEKIHIIDLLGEKDANDYLVKYDADSLRDRVSLASQLPLENVVTVKDIEDELEDFVHNGFKPGFQIGLNNFDDIFSTYTGQFITVTGIPSSGKSDFVDQMMVGYNEKYGWKTAYASPENKPTFLHTHKLVRKFGRWMPNKEDIGGPKWNKILDHVNDNFFFMEMDTYDLDAVLKKGSELVRRKGIRCLVIDPFNKVTLKGVDRKHVTDYTMEYLARIDAWCRKNDCLVVLVAHPTKMYKNLTTGQIDEPTMYNIKGGGEFYDASYHGLLVHRNYEEKTVKVKVLKVKFQNLGDNGAEAHFKWDPISGRYNPLEVQTTEMPW